ncbi:hypothetical protein D1AOALGA4SA_5701 [Olavius algarvensis Delta 1 endosymbiont]|nr:hypothetical protein D1AOALGA4SA_5701 [Olavius algarvensis Delta 1 endosymbiont]
MTKTTSAYYLSWVVVLFGSFGFFSFGFVSNFGIRISNLS